MSWRRRTRVRSWTRPAWWTERHAVSAAGVHRRQNGTYSATDDHFTAGPDCRVEPSGIRRVGSASRRPTIEVGIVSAAGIEIGCVISSTPDDHFRSGPDCCVTPSGIRRVGSAGRHPTIIGRIVSPAGVQMVSVIGATPDDHFRAGPHCWCDMFGFQAHWLYWWLPSYPLPDYISRRCSKYQSQD